MDHEDLRPGMCGKRFTIVKLFSSFSHFRPQLVNMSCETGATLIISGTVTNVLCDDSVCFDMASKLEEPFKRLKSMGKCIIRLSQVNYFPSFFFILVSRSACLCKWDQMSDGTIKNSRWQFVHKRLLFPPNNALLLWQMLLLTFIHRGREFTNIWHLTVFQQAVWRCL